MSQRGLLKESKTFARIVLLATLLGTAVGLEACAPKAENPEIWYVWSDSSPWMQTDSGNDEVRVIDPVTGFQRVILRNEPGSRLLGPELSLDGNHLVFYRLTNSRQSLWVVNSNGSRPTRVTEEAEWVGMFWLDDHTLLVSTASDMHNANLMDWYFYDLVTGSLRLAVIRDHSILDTHVWNKSSLTTERFVERRDLPIFFAGHLEQTGNSLTFVSDFNVNISQHTDYGWPCCFSWSIDGKKLLFQAEQRKSSVNDMFVASAQSQSVINLSNFEKDYKETTIRNLAISPDGRRVIAIVQLIRPRYEGELQPLEVLLFNTGNGSTESFGPQYFEHESVSKVMWSPNSRYISMTWIPQDKGGDAQIHVLDTQTKTIKQLTFDSGTKTIFDWR